jgi:hypothetical protein
MQTTLRLFFLQVPGNPQDSTFCACPPCTLVFLAVPWHSFTYYSFPRHSSGKCEWTHFRQKSSPLKALIVCNAELSFSQRPNSLQEVIRCIKKCGGWDSNPSKAGDIEAILNISRTFPFFLFWHVYHALVF